jgi:tripartite-type tricarboxylate transporter receptor subunit TctC
MKPSKIVRLIRIAALAFATSAHMAAFAQDSKPWPQKTVRIVIPTAPGAPIDIIARLLQPKLQAQWGQPIVIENKPGAGGNVGMLEVARSSDDHTLLGGPTSMNTVNPHIYKKIGIDPIKDLIPITYLAAFNSMLVCNPKLGLDSAAALVKRAKAESMIYASSGAGGPGHMITEAFLAATGLKMTHVPYRGPSPAALDIASGQAQCGFIATPVVLPLMKDGKLTALAVSGTVRSPLAPNVPTVSETVAAGFDATFYETLQAPRSMPPSIVAKINKDVVELLKTPEIRNKLQELDLILIGNTPAAAATRTGEDFLKWGGIAKTINLQLD